MNKTTNSLLTIAIILVTTWSASAATFAEYRLLKISAADQRAVVQSPDGSLRVIRVGDKVDGAQVTEIVEGRVVLTGKDAETIIIRFENGRQQIEALQRSGEVAPPMTAPGVMNE
ncbi:MAG: hypothetical protein E4G91_03870 [Candidatus Zixiibacteriota bacterium]|nr:MAG: hypothetical protein E4G91_03870 [candidate division Zixibacteria bacterium]